MNNWMMETKEWKLKCIVNDDNVLLDEKKCFILKKQLDEEKNVLRNTLMYINSHSKEIPNFTLSFSMSTNLSNTCNPTPR
jgi:hypothetical protein